MELYKNKYRGLSHRLRGWDYAGNGYYFITIVTHERKNYFGQIENGEMIYNEMGKIVHDEFFKSFEIREELFLGEFVLMPNHLHAIIILNKPKCTAYDVGLNGRSTLRDRANQPQKFERKPKSISSFVACFKSSTIRRIDDYIDANNLNINKFNKDNKLWQPNYHDHIIRNETEYRDISKYIIENPKKWEESEQTP
ncbi:MAG: transposase [Bacteroidales bacterium]|nr:transposase [Bacteroidales bacterium]